MRWPVITTYTELTKVVSAFSAETSHMGSLVLVGAPGTGKSTLRRSLDGTYVVESVATGYGLYREVYEHASADKIVLDDVDPIWKDPRGLTLLKCLLQTDKKKAMQWNTAAADRDGIPRKFETSARILIICNSIDGCGKNFAAVVDRLIGYHFEPSAQEVHEEARSFGDVIAKEVSGFIAGYLSYIPTPSLRDYINATQLHRSGLDYREMLMGRWFEDRKLVCVLHMVKCAQSGDPPHFATAAERVAHFERLKLGTRSTYFEYQSKVLDMMGEKRVITPKHAKMRDDENSENQARSMKMREEFLERQAQLEKDRISGLVPSAAEYTRALIAAAEARATTPAPTVAGDALTSVEPINFIGLSSPVVPEEPTETPKLLSAATDVVASAGGTSTYSTDSGSMPPALVTGVSAPVAVNAMPPVVTEIFTGLPAPDAPREASESPKLLTAGAITEVPKSGSPTETPSILLSGLPEKSGSPTIPQLPEAIYEQVITNRPYSFSTVRICAVEQSGSPMISDERITIAFETLLGKVPANLMRACKPKFRKRSKTLEQLKALPIDLKRQWIFNWQKSEDEKQEQEELAARDAAFEKESVVMD